LADTVFEGAMAAVLETLSGVVGRVRACVALGVNRATWYRRHRTSRRRRDWCASEDRTPRR
jgi:hypothetical protein